MTEEQIEDVLAAQIPEVNETPVKTNETPVSAEEVSNEAQENPSNEATQYLGTKLTHRIGKTELGEDDKTLAERKGLTKTGEHIATHADIREGWIDVNKNLLGDRAKFYPEDWQFRIRPASVEAIRNWSTIDDENPNSVDDVFNEILKSCLSIKTATGMVPWGNVNSWDRFFFLLLIREYSFKTGERELKYSEDCPECSNDVEFQLNSQALMYELPDDEVMPMYSTADRAWNIDPAEYDVVGYEPLTLYVPTLEKDAAIKAWMISQIRENPNRKIDAPFLRFLGWLAPKISKDETIAKRQIKQYRQVFDSWDTEMFDFMDQVLKNIIVTPLTKLTTQCPTCHEEVTSNIRFPNNIRDLFAIQSKHRKFGKK